MSPRFISCDWGTSTFRLRLDGTEVRTDEGAAKLAAAGGDRAEAFRAALVRGLERLGAPAELPVVISGMAGSSIGWRELPYARLPFALDGRDAVWESLGPRVFLVSGLRSETDVMRGEETEAIGAAARPGGLPAESVLVLPGTHSKHVDLAEGRITGFRTFLTGELFDVMSRHSVLRHSTEPDAPFDRAAFLEGVEESRRLPVPAALFRVRTRQVLDRKGAAANTSFLSGILVGAELGALPQRRIVICAGAKLAAPYRAAAESLGMGPRLTCVPAEEVERLSVAGQGVLLDRILAGK